MKRCPNREAHTEGPDDYRDWHEWAERKAKTHVQKQCPDCELWAIWVPKEAADHA